jgi:hypothetical protein
MSDCPHFVEPTGAVHLADFDQPVGERTAYEILSRHARLHGYPKGLHQAESLDRLASSCTLAAVMAWIVPCRLV